MPLFIYRGVDGPRGSQLRQTATRERHLEHIQVLVDQGRIRFAGPLISETGPCGSLILLEAEDLDSARRIAESDPYLTEGVFERVEVWETKQVKP